MQKNKHDEKKSQLKKTADRIYELQKNLRNPPRIPLEKKIFAGHWRFLTVRKDILRSSIGGQVDAVVQACNSYRFGKKDQPNSFRGSCEIYCQTPEGGLPTWVSGQGLHPLSAKEYEEIPLPEAQKKKWFLRTDQTLRCGSKNLLVPRYYPQIPKHMLEYGYKTAYITEVSLPDGPKESELIRLYQYMERIQGWEKLHGRRPEDHQKNKKKAIKKALRRDLEEEIEKKL
jgi:hypothetical protein